MNFFSQNKALLARLEKLEKVALGSIQSKDLASSKINFKSLNRELKKWFLIIDMLKSCGALVISAL